MKLIDVNDPLDIDVVKLFPETKLQFLNIAMEDSVIHSGSVIHYGGELPTGRYIELDIYIRTGDFDKEEELFALAEREDVMYMSVKVWKKGGEHFIFGWVFRPLIHKEDKYFGLY